MIPGPRAATTRPSRKTTARSYSRRILSPLIRNAARMAIAAHAPSIAASLQRFSGRAPRAGLRCPGLATPRIEFIALGKPEGQGAREGSPSAATRAGRERLKGGGAPPTRTTPSSEVLGAVRHRRGRGRFLVLRLLGHHRLD